MHYYSGCQGGGGISSLRSLCSLSLIRNTREQAEFRDKLFALTIIAQIVMRLVAYLTLEIFISIVFMHWQQIVEEVLCR